MFKWKSLLMGIGLTLLLIMIASITALAAADAENNPSLNYPSGKEVMEARSEHTKLFKTDDNADTLFISMMPLHFQDKQGNWQEIDTTLQDANGETDEDGETFGYHVLKNTFKCYLPRHSKGWVELKTGDYRLAFKLMTGNNEKKQFVTRKHDIYINDLLYQCDINLTVKNGGIKEDIILKNKTAPQEFKYQIRLNNLNIRQSDTGTIQFINNQDNIIFIMPKFYMYDSKNNFSEDITTNIEQHDNSYILTIKPNQQWLNSTERVYPVTIDPTTVNIQAIGGDPSGNGRTLYYMPAIGFINATSDRSYSQSFSSGSTVGINHWNRLFNIPNILPYPVQIQYTAVSQGTSAPWYGAGDGSFTINYWNPNAQNDDDSNITSCLHSYPFHANIQNDTDSGSFILQPGQAVRFELSNPVWARLFWMSTWSGNCTLTIKCQKESMSPKPTQLNQLPPEKPGSTVSLRWEPAVDDWNQDAWDQDLYASVRPIPAELCKTGQVMGYKIQYATDASFTSPQDFTGAMTLDPNTGEYTCSITGLAQNTTCYFRCCGIDAEGNPTNMRPWNNWTNPSGPRWSNIVVTKCIAPLPNGVPTKPSIIDINPEYQVSGEQDRYYCNSQSSTITWTPTQTQAKVCLMNENSLLNSYFDTNNSTNSFTIPKINDGNYLVYVQNINDVGGSPWSNPWKITIDMTPPIISAITETINNGDVKLKFSSSEPVQVNIYWDSNPVPLAVSPTNYIQYDGTDSGGTIDLGYLCADPNILHYYRLDIKDKAQNTYSTGTIQLGNGVGNNVANTDRNFGFEKFWSFQTIDLGRAGIANINLNNGNLIICANDYSIPGRGIPLIISRFYNSLADYQGMFGKGWRSSFEMYLTISGQDVIINDSDGSSHKFTSDGSSFTRPNGDYRRIIFNPDQSYTVLETNGLRYNFGVPQNGNCRLNSVVDRFGNTLTFNYNNSTGFLTSVVEPSGRITALFEYNYYEQSSQHYLLSAIRFTPLESGASSSRYVTFSYLGGKLSEVRYPASGGSLEVAVNYTYDSLMGLLSSSRVCLMNGGSEQNNSRKNDTNFGYKPYKRSIGLVSTSFTQGGSMVPVSYYFDYNGDATTVTDPRGNQTVFTYYGSGSPNNGQCRNITWPDCKKADGITTATKPATTYYTYDTDYNLKTATRQKDVYNPLTGQDESRNVVTTYNYNSISGSPKSIIADDGDPALGCKKLITRITYEPEHNGVLTDVHTVTDPGGNTMTYTNTYDANGKLTQLEITPPAGSDTYTIIHTFDQYGERIDKDVKVGNESTARYHFDYGYQNGLLSSLTNTFGSANYYYTLYGERKGVLDASNVQTNNTIDGSTGYLTAVGAPEELSSQRRFSDYLLTGAQNRLTFGYDVNGNKLTETDSQNNISYYNFNELNLLISSVKQTVQSRCIYDANGNMINIYDSRSNNNIITYDAMNRRVQIRANMGSTPNDLIQEENEYDSSGRIKVSWDGYKVGNGHGNRKQYYYDSTDNLLRVKNYDNNSLVSQQKYTYDANGNMLTKAIPLSANNETGKIVTSYQYDALNRPILVTTSCATNDKYNQTVSYTYEAGQLKTMTVSVYGGSPQTTTYYYDAAMRLDYITNQTGQKFQFKYFPGGQRRKK